MCTLRAFVFLLLNEIIIAPTSEECCKNPENVSNVLQQCLAHTANQQPLCLVLFTHSLQQPLAIASATSISQREACAQSQRLAQDYNNTSSKNTDNSNSGLSEAQRLLFLQSCQLLPWFLHIFLYLLVGGKVRQADFMVPSSITTQGGRIKASAAEKQDSMLLVPPNTVP